MYSVHSTMSENACRLVSLNGKAAHLIAIGSNHEAVGLLRQGLASVLSDLQSSASLSKFEDVPMVLETDDESSVSSFDDEDDSSDAHVVTSIDALHLPKESMSVCPNNAFTIFNKALHFEKFEPATLLSDKTRVASVFLYNIGLAYHREGIQTGTSHFLHRALEFYKMAFETLDQSESFDTDFITFVMLAVTNNIGHIKSHFFEIDEMQECRSLLHSLLSTTVPGACMGEDEYAFFHHSLVFQSSVVRFAPSA